MGEEHRRKIANSNILKCLVEHAEGRREMTASQVSAGIALLRKVMPDLMAVDMQADMPKRTIADKPMTAEEWAAEFAGDEQGQSTAH